MDGKPEEGWSCPISKDDSRAEKVRHSVTGLDLVRTEMAKVAYIATAIQTRPGGLAS